AVGRGDRRHPARRRARRGEAPRLVAHPPLDGGGQRAFPPALPQSWVLADGPRRRRRGRMGARAVKSALDSANDPGAEVRTASLPNEKALVTYSEVRTLASTNAQPGDRGACRRR